MDADQQEDEQLRSSCRSASRRILVADDNRDAAESLAALLQLDGHEVTIVHDGNAALTAFAQFSPHIALLDIGMAGMNGYEVAREIRQAHPTSSAKLIAITGWGQENDKQRAFDAGFNHHFTKPVDLQRLSALIEAAPLISRAGGAD